MSSGDRQRALDVWASWSRLAAAALFAGLSLSVLAQTAPAAWRAETAPEPPPRALPEPGSATRESPLAELVRPAEPEASTEPPSLPSARQLLIDLGPPRSEVFVDGRRVGQSPFVGQVKCRPGREIRIQVVPERGLPIEERRVCPP